jgi:hypothetical protein
MSLEKVSQRAVMTHERLRKRWNIRISLTAFRLWMRGIDDRVRSLVTRVERIDVCVDSVFTLCSVHNTWRCHLPWWRAWGSFTLVTLSLHNSLLEGRDCAFGIATRYWLDGPTIESLWEQQFPHPTRPALGPNQPPVQCLPDLFPVIKRPECGVNQPFLCSAEVKEREELYLYSPSGPSWPVIRCTLPFNSLWDWKFCEVCGQWTASCTWSTFIRGSRIQRI